MGLKKDIEDAFIKNITPGKDNEFQISAEARKKVEVLAEDLSKAIVDFITAQTFAPEGKDAFSLIGNLFKKKTPTVENKNTVPAGSFSITPKPKKGNRRGSGVN